MPWGYKIDNGLVPPGTDGYVPKQGKAAIHQKDGWTAISFVDNSIDKRPGSNSGFIAEGTFDFPEMLEMFKTSFPEVVKRFKFEIVPA